MIYLLILAALALALAVAVYIIVAQWLFIRRLREAAALDAEHIQLLKDAHDLGAETIAIKEQTIETYRLALDENVALNAWLAGRNERLAGWLLKALQGKVEMSATVQIESLRDRLAGRCMN